VGTIVDVPAGGLSSDEAAARLAADGPNELPASKKQNLAAQAWDVVRQPMLLLLVGAGSVNFLLAEPLDGATLMSFVVVVIAISLYQEHKTENALTALRDLSSPRALVLRDGRQQRIPGRAVVRGDVVLLAEGDRVPADAVLTDCVNLTVDESALTGESVPVRKAPAADATRPLDPPGGDGSASVFSGTLVVRGHGVASVAATGAQTQLGRIGSTLGSLETERTPLQREVDRLVRRLAVAGAAVALVVVVVRGLTRGGWLEASLAGIATAMAMLPEEFPVVFTVFLALGAWRMSQRNVLTRRPAVIETLGAATVVCVDKTGTLTHNAMTVASLLLPDAAHDIDDGPLPEAFHALAEFGVLASPVDPFDPMDKAFRELGDRTLASTEHLHADWVLVREYPLSEHLLALSHVWRSPDADRYVVAAKGAPEAIADLCHLPAGRRAALLEQVERTTAHGYRLLAVARASFAAADTLPTDQHEFTFELLGLVALHDPLRADVPDAVRECARAGVRTVMITGDHPGTALAIAEAAGIGTERCVTGPELAAMSEPELADAVRTTSVFARTMPEQKLQLVRALQAGGEIVVMTGDGVNDAPALRAADIGIAMGRRGTDVAREAAALVITDDNFASIVGGIRRGRGIYDNIRKAMAYIIAVHVPIVGMSLLPLFGSDWVLVLLPVQIAFLELIIDPACSVVFEAEQADPALMDQPPRAAGASMLDRRALTIAVGQGISSFVAVAAVYAWTVAGDEPAGTVRAATLATLVFSNLLLILTNRSWRLPIWRTFVERRNPTVPWILGGAAALLAVQLTVPGVRRAFGLGPVSLGQTAVALVAATAGVAWFEVWKVVRAARGLNGGAGRPA
jgi:Ca2+-transporting ATPase